MHIEFIVTSHNSVDQFQRFLSTQNLLKIFNLSAMQLNSMQLLADLCSHILKCHSTIYHLPSFSHIKNTLFFCCKLAVFTERIFLLWRVYNRVSMVVAHHKSTLHKSKSPFYKSLLFATYSSAHIFLFVWRSVIKISPTLYQRKSDLIQVHLKSLSKTMSLIETRTLRRKTKENFGFI